MFYDGRRGVVWRMFGVRQSRGSMAATLSYPSRARTPIHELAPAGVKVSRSDAFFG